MAEGGDFENENFHLDYLIDHDDDYGRPFVSIFAKSNSLSLN